MAGAKRRDRRRRLVATTAAVYLTTGKRDLFLLYGNHLDASRERGGGRRNPDVQPLIRPDEARPALRRALLLRAVLSVGLRGEPGRFRYSSRKQPGTSASGACLSRSSFLRSSSFLCVLAVAGIVVWAARRRSAASERVREIRLLLEMAACVGPGVLRQHDDRLAPSSLRLRSRFPPGSAGRRGRRQPGLSGLWASSHAVEAGGSRRSSGSSSSLSSSAE